jgi:DNA-binding transcriptional LysR family regulator
LARGKFRHLQVLLRLAELGSVQRTADTIGMTQSAVTQTLAYLENLLEVRLFNRHARGVRPTSACLDLLPVARQVLQGLMEGTEVVVAHTHQGRRSIRLIASAAATNGLLVQRLQGFHQQHPDIEVLLREAENDDQLMAIARGEVDLVVCRQRGVVPEGWAFEALMPDRLVVVCRPNHPLAKRRQVTLAQLGLHPWLLTPSGSAARERFDALATGFDTPPSTHPLVTRSLPVLSAVLQQEPLLSLLPISIVQHMVGTGQLVVLPFADGGELEPLGVLRPQSDMPEASMKLIRFLKPL